MIELSQEMADALNGSFKWYHGNVPELDEPVLVVFDYSPSNAEPPLSLAFSLAAGPKCWLSESRVQEINDIGPSAHPDYRRFRLEGRRFYPYSIVALPTTCFERLEVLEQTCRRLYQHVVWD